jgi:hypothetical protein
MVVFKNLKTRFQCTVTENHFMCYVYFARVKNVLDREVLVQSEYIIRSVHNVLKKFQQSQNVESCLYVTVVTAQLMVSTNQTYNKNQTHTRK